MPQNFSLGFCRCVMTKLPDWIMAWILLQGSGSHRAEAGAGRLSTGAVGLEPLRVVADDGLALGERLEEREVVDPQTTERAVGLRARIHADAVRHHEDVVLAAPPLTREVARRRVAEEAELALVVHVERE